MEKGKRVVASNRQLVLGLSILTSNGWRQSQIAETLGAHRRTVGGWILGNTRVSAAYRRPLEELIRTEMARFIKDKIAELHEMLTTLEEGDPNHES